MLRNRPSPPTADPTTAGPGLPARWEELSRTDPVTGLPGPLGTQDALDLAVWAARTGGEVLGVLTVAVDGVDDVRLRFGDAAADDVLRAAALRLRGRLRHGDVVGRLGELRFAAAVPGLAPDAAERETARIADALTAAVGAPFVVAGELVVLDVRVGTALCPLDADDVGDLLALASAREAAPGT